MKQEIFINSTPQESRIAIMEDGQLAEFLIERKADMGVAGNIYKGKVARVLPGMQAAFVDIGMDKAGFLHASDFSMEPEDVPLIGSSGDEVEFEEAPKRPPSRRVPLEKQISRGEEVLVQVAKDPLGTKGARVTSHVSLPGRYMVFMPGTHHIGISRRIESEEERKRLREIAQALKTDQGGFILRTACEGLSKREIQRDLSFLTKLWDRIQKKSAAAAAPSLIHQDLDLIMRAIRDFFTADTAQVVVDAPKDHRRIIDFVHNFMPRLKSKIVLHSEKTPLFEQHAIEEKITKALERRVWLRVRRLHHHRAHRGIDRSRCEYRPICREKKSGRDNSQDQFGSDSGSRAAAAAEECRRHYHYRFHRYGEGSRPKKSLRRTQRSAETRQGAHQHFENFRAWPGRDDAPTNAREPGKPIAAAVPAL